MNGLLDLAALSLLPSPAWRHAADALRAGEPAGAVLTRLAAARRPDGPEYERALRAGAAHAVARARKVRP